jgi:large subunit ribosomal protein L33
MAKGKVKSMAIKLLSTAGTGFFYITTKNPRNVLRKLSLKKVITWCIYHVDIYLIINKLLLFMF